MTEAEVHGEFGGEESTGPEHLPGDAQDKGVQAVFFIPPTPYAGVGQRKNRDARLEADRKLPFLHVLFTGQKPKKETEKNEERNSLHKGKQSDRLEPDQREGGQRRTPISSKETEGFAGAFEVLQIFV